MIPGIPQQSLRTPAQIIRDDWWKIFPKKFYKVDHEHKVYGSFRGPERPGWSIDFVADYYGDRYIIECDINESAVDIWHGFKIFGYRAAYCIDRNLKTNHVKLMMFFNDSIFTHRVRNILTLAEVEYCTFNVIGDAVMPIKSSLWEIK